MKLPLFLMVFLILPSIAPAKDTTCEKWFKQGKLSVGKECLLKCVSLPVDLGTFDCPQNCEEFCESPLKEKWVFKLSDLYPGLTPSEKALAAQHPVEVLTAYKQSWEAENICLTEYPRSATNDESDACRHFTWAVLLQKKLGDEMAQKILDAHEQEPTQPEEEKAMDLANNQRGISFARSLDKEATSERILAEFRKLLKEGKLIVLKKGGLQ